MSKRQFLVAISLVLSVAGSACGTDLQSASDAGDLSTETVQSDVGPICMGTPCSTVSDCGKSSPCVSKIACEAGCCVRTFSVEGTGCTVGCQVGGQCNAAGECADTTATVCPEEDGNPCTQATCEEATGICGAEIPLEDGATSVTSKCWTGLVCNDGKPDSSAAEPTELYLSCQQQDEELDPFGCVAQVICVDSSNACLEIAEEDGEECWTGDGDGSSICTGHSCQQSKCVVDGKFTRECDSDDFPESCESDCQACTELTCHWIADPDAPGETKKKVGYCKPGALVGEECEDGSECSQGDACVFDGQSEGPLGKETLGLCMPGEGKGKTDCLIELGKPELPCLLLGVKCTEEEGCHIEQASADEWCYPPESVCYDKDATYCTHLDPGDGLWNEETGCHTQFIDVNCEDNNECTIDKCKVDADDVYCEHKPVEGAACNDDNPCMINGLCVSGECVAEPKCVDADDNPCTKAGCDPTDGSCLGLPDDGVACDDQNVCTDLDVCTGGECTGNEPIDCDDGEVCSTDSCDPILGCQHGPAEGACDDNNACTIGDICTDSACQPGSESLNCDDGDVCTDDSCDPLLACVHTNNMAVCDDGNACTTGDICSNGFCEGTDTSGNDCDDDNVCTDDTCDPLQGCVYPDNALQCSDGNECTMGDQCQTGECVGGPALVCDDSDACNGIETCDPAAGCVAGELLVCDDTNTCNGVETCSPAEGCVDGEPLVCVDGNLCTDDSCDPQAGCVFSPNNIDCDDDNACTEGDKCESASCMPGDPVDCNDQNECTDDSCDTVDGCANEPVAYGTECGEGIPLGCVDGVCECIPQCDGLECGDDQCGGSCGECPVGSYCDAGQCVPTASVWFDGETYLTQPELGIKGAKTYSLWFYAHDVEKDQVLLIKKDTPSNPVKPRPVKMWLQDGVLTMRTIYQGLPGETVVASTPVEASTWHHLAFQISKTKAELFLDGKQVDESDIPNASIDNDHSYTVGAAPQMAGYAEFFKGYMYNLRIVSGFTYDDDFLPCDLDPVTAESFLINGTGPVPCACLPQCNGKECGDDGCGGSCGECGDGLGCCEGQCTECCDGNDVTWDGCNDGKIMEFQVNQYATGDQYYPAVATLSDGRFVVTWDTEGKDGSGKAVVARVYSAQSNPEGDEFVVNTYTDDDQAVPVLLGLADGRFLAIWQSTGQDGSYQGIFGQLFNVDGGKQGGEFQANTYVQDTQAGASIAMVNNGGFLVTWDGGHAQDGSGYGVFGQMYDGVGAKNGGEFQINTFFSDSQMHSSLASLPGGGFISSWMSKGQDGDGFGVFAQVSEADGSKKGNEFQLNSHTDGDQDYPRIGAFADGRFVSVWESDGQDGDGWGVFAQCHEATGAVLGEEFQVNSLSAGDQRGPVVATLAADRFVAVWSGEGSGDDIGIHGQLFDAAGAKIGQPFVVNGHVSGWQWGTALSVFADGSFVVVWTSDGQDGDGRGIFAQRFNPDGTKKYK